MTWLVTKRLSCTVVTWLVTKRLSCTVVTWLVTKRLSYTVVTTRFHCKTEEILQPVYLATSKKYFKIYATKLKSKEYKLSGSWENNEERTRIVKLFCNVKHATLLPLCFIVFVIFHFPIFLKNFPVIIKSKLVLNKVHKVEKRKKIFSISIHFITWLIQVSDPDK